MSPWTHIPSSPPYVLECDHTFVEHFNQKRAKESTRIHTDLLPEPYFGNINARVVVLLLNPGVGTSDEQLHATEEFSSALRSAYASTGGTKHLHLSAESQGAGSKWWARTCKALLEHLSKDQLADKLLTVEFSPYHSRSFGHADYRLPSQDFGFELVKQAMSNDALIVCMRGERFWYGAIPQLAKHGRLLHLRNPRSASLSPGNMDGYKELLKALQVER